MEHYLSLKDHVYRYISDCINSGTLNPGDKINEAQVSETLNISRTPIREALVQLASDGYLDSARASASKRSTLRRSSSFMRSSVHWMAVPRRCVYRISPKRT